MMRKLAFFGALASLALCGASVCAEPVALRAEESISEIQETKATLECSVFHKDESTGETVADETGKYGDFIVSETEGFEGDVVSVIIQGNPVMETIGSNVFLYRYLISEVSFNGETIQPIDARKGEYSVKLAAGVNVLTILFSGKAEISVVDLANMNWKSLLTVDNLIKLITVVALLGISSGFFITLIKGKKIKAVTMREVEEQLTEVGSAFVKTFMENTVKPLLEAHNGQVKDVGNAISVLTRVSLLMMDDTNESRLAAIKELQNYKSTDEELAKRIQSIVEAAIKKASESKEASQKALEEAKKAVEAIEVPEEKPEDEFGSL